MWYDLVFQLHCWGSRGDVRRRLSFVGEISPAPSAPPSSYTALAMTALLVKLATTPVQALQGFTDVHPLSARSVAAVPPPPSAAPLLPAVNKWLNVPFATAARWSRPTAYVAPSAEEGAVRKCFEFGATPLQGPGAVEPLWTCKDGWLDRDFVGEDEDCLSLNVFVPKEASEQAAREGRQLPVMVSPATGGDVKVLMVEVYCRCGCMEAHWRRDMRRLFDMIRRNW